MRTLMIPSLAFAIGLASAACGPQAGSLDAANPLVFAAPLFILAIALVIVGVIVGGVVTWFRQGKWRKQARQAESEMRALRAENESLKREVELRSVVTVPQIAPPGLVVNRTE